MSWFSTFSATIARFRRTCHHITCFAYVSVAIFGFNPIFDDFVDYIRGYALLSRKIT
jgi:cytochrome b subunit of formate dehydrogenase